MANATEAQAEEAVAILKRAIDAAQNSNQAGENAVVKAAAALSSPQPWTDEELDRARAQEANRRAGWSGLGCIPKPTPCEILAARLAREGWMPPDPLEVEFLLLWNNSDGLSTADLMRKAIRRGVEIGREQSR